MRCGGAPKFRLATTANKFEFKISFSSGEQFAAFVFGKIRFVDDKTLQAVVDEIAPILRNRSLGKIFQIGKLQFVIDFRPGDGRYLFLNFEAQSVPRLYLVRRRVRDLEKQSEHTGNFALFARKQLADAGLVKIAKDANDRIVRFQFLAEDETSGAVNKLTVVAQLTGRTANLFLLDAENKILDSLRETNERGEVYNPPQIEISVQSDKQSLLEIIEKIELPPTNFDLSPASPLSAKLDAYFSNIEAEREFELLATRARGRIRQEINKKEKLLQRLEHDLTKHGDADEAKKTGDLLLANQYTARRENNKIFAVDYFDESAPEIVIEVNDNSSLPEAAAKFFARYSKARNAANELTQRISNLESQISNLKSKQTALEATIAQRDAAKLNDFLTEINLLVKPQKADETTKPKKKDVPAPSGTRRYRSSDGLEILLGRSSKDNDFLTVRVAKSLDWWLHAADYPGSHVVVRNPSKGELPPKTLLEAAQLAAKFSQAREDSKVAVNYTQRKFVSKPKNAAVGTVRLASFRTILVEPREAGERIL